MGKFVYNIYIYIRLTPIYLILNKIKLIRLSDSDADIYIYIYIYIYLINFILFYLILNI